MNTHASTDRLAELLCRKLGVLEEILSLCQTQAEFVQRDEVDALMEVLAAKQALLDQMHVLQTELAPFGCENPEQRVWHSERRREQTREVAQRCELTLERIMSLEKLCEVRLTARRDEVAADLKAADSAQHASEAYSNLIAPPRSSFEILSDA